MTPVDAAFMLDVDTELNLDILNEVGCALIESFQLLVDFMVH